MKAGPYPLIIIAAVADNGVIGRDNQLIWRLRTDLKRFKALTLGRPMVMGRKTFASIGKALPGRENIVLTRDRNFTADGVRVVHSLDDALALAQERAAAMGADSIPIVGGADLYAQTLPMADVLHMTFVHASPKGDAHFPDFDASHYRETFREAHSEGPGDDHAFTFVDFSRERP